MINVVTRPALILATIITLWSTQCCRMSRADTNHPKALTVVAVGDIMMGTTYPVNILPPDDGEGMFRAVGKEFQGTDMVFGNLEGVLCDEGQSVKCKVPLSGNCFEFLMPARYSSHLREAGFTVLNIANNHSLDFGLEGGECTVRNLQSAGIQATGGETIASFRKGDRRIAVVGFSYKPSPQAHSITDIQQAQQIVGELKKSHDIIIVSFHGGSEGKNALHIPHKEEIFLTENRGNVVAFSRAVIDAGADMVIGHGPHVLRAMEVYKGKLIAYSLGNFLTYALFNLKGPNSLSIIMKVRIDGATGNFLEGRLVPVHLTNGGIPEIDCSGEAINLMKKLTARDMKPQSIVIEDNGVIRPMTR